MLGSGQPVCICLPRNTSSSGWSLAQDPAWGCTTPSPEAQVKPEQGLPSTGPSGVMPLSPQPLCSKPPMLSTMCAWHGGQHGCPWAVSKVNTDPAPLGGGSGSDGFY